MKKFWLELRQLVYSRLMIVLVVVNVAVYVFARDVTVYVLEHSPWFYKYLRNSYLDTRDRDQVLRFMYERYSSDGGLPAGTRLELDGFRDAG